MKTLCFGSANIDHVYKVNHFTRPGETQSCLEYSVGCGGKGFNQAVAMALAGNDTYFAGVIGRDGSILKDTMLKKGVKTDFLKETEKYNGHAIIEVDRSGQNHIVLYGGTNQTIEREYVDEVMEHFGEGDIVVLQNEINEVPYIIERCHAKKMTIIFNAAPYDDGLKDFPIEKVTWLVVNETEGAGLSRAGCFRNRAFENGNAENVNVKNGNVEKDNLENGDIGKIPGILYSMYGGVNILLTLGAQGSRAITADEDIYVPAYPVKAVDTTGAGDTFIGYFVRGISEGMPPEGGMRLASAASALAVSRPGAAESVPCYKEVCQFMQ